MVCTHEGDYVVDYSGGYSGGCSFMGGMVKGTTLGVINYKGGYCS